MKDAAKTKLNALACSICEGNGENENTETFVRNIVDGIKHSYTETEDGFCPLPVSFSRKPLSERCKKFVEFFDSVGIEDLVDLVGDERGIELAKIVGEELLKRANAQSESPEATEFVKYFCHALDSASNNVE